jgi:electron transport complex protein RnfG
MSVVPNLGQIPGPIELIKVLGAVATVCGILIVSVYQITAGAREANQQRAREIAVLQVVPQATSYVEFALNTDSATAILKGVVAPKETRPVFVGYQANGEMSGIALEAGAPGYSDIVKILYNYSPSCECITGFTILSSKETPGLGDKIVTDDNFQANFQNPGLEAKLDSDKMALANAIETVKHGTKTHPWQIDAISGATITSRAVGKGINQSAQMMLPLVVKHLETLKVKPVVNNESVKTEDKEVK